VSVGGLILNCRCLVTPGYFSYFVVFPWRFATLAFPVVPLVEVELRSPNVTRGGVSIGTDAGIGVANGGTPFPGLALGGLPIGGLAVGGLAIGGVPAGGGAIGGVAAGGVPGDGTAAGGGGALVRTRTGLKYWSQMLPPS
jgi:hypothetical protein